MKFSSTPSESKKTSTWVKLFLKSCWSWLFKDPISDSFYFVLDGKNITSSSLCVDWFDCNSVAISRSLFKLLTKSFLFFVLSWSVSLWASLSSTIYLLFDKLLVFPIMGKIGVRGVIIYFWWRTGLCWKGSAVPFGISRSYFQKIHNFLDFEPGLL